MFRNAIVRPPGNRFAEGLTTARLGAPILEKALEQHARYCEALERAGLSLTRLEPDPRFPDGTFVEDDAVLTPRCAILARPGAESRRGEVAGIREALARFYRKNRAIEAPGTVDGGDVCEAEGHFFIGISERTNEAGAEQLAGLLEKEGFSSTRVDIRKIRGILHLKSGIAYLGDRRLALIASLAGREEFHGYGRLLVEAAEEYAANCVRINDRLFMAAGFPALERTLASLGCEVVTLEMSEFRKMDGGLSCLSLRF